MGKGSSSSKNKNFSILYMKINVDRMSTDCIAHGGTKNIKLKNQFMKTKRNKKIVFMNICQNKFGKSHKGIIEIQECHFELFFHSIFIFTQESCLRILSE